MPATQKKRSENGLRNHTLDTPLFAHQCGHWARKIKGRLIYFGRWDQGVTPEEAYDLFKEERDKWYAWRDPPRLTRSNTADGCWRYVSSSVLTATCDLLPELPTSHDNAAMLVATEVATSHPKPERPCCGFSMCLSIRLKPRHASRKFVVRHDLILQGQQTLFLRFVVFRRD